MKNFLQDMKLGAKNNSNFLHESRSSQVAPEIHHPNVSRNVFGAGNIPAGVTACKWNLCNFIGNSVDRKIFEFLSEGSQN